MVHPVRFGRLFHSRDICTLTLERARIPSSPGTLEMVKSHLLYDESSPTLTMPAPVSRGFPAMTASRERVVHLVRQ
jgi:hypothetical protein